MSLSIAFLVWEFPVLSETFILNQITGLIDRGHQVDIYALNGRSGQSGDTVKMHPVVEQYHLLEHTYYAPRMPANPVVRLLKSPGLLFANWLRDPGVILRSLHVGAHGMASASLRLFHIAIPFLGRRRYDIIHCQFGTIGLEGMLLRRIGALEGKLITSFRGYDISRALQASGDAVYNGLFEAGDFFLPNCAYFKRRLLDLGCATHRVAVHGSGIECRRFPFRLRQLRSDGRIRVVTTGRLVEKKGIEYSIRAVAKLAKGNPHLEYCIIGDGPLREDLQRLILELGVQGQVQLLGQKAHQDVVHILDESDLFIAPSVTAQDGDQDGSLNVLKEAMAMGLPVVSTWHGGIPELVEDGISGFLVPERDTEALAIKLGYLIAHPQMWSQMGQAGRVFVNTRYDLNMLNDKLAEIYQSVMAEGTDRSAGRCYQP